MQQPKLTAEIWVKAHIRRCQAAGAFATLIRHGDDTAGALYIKLNNLSGNFQIFSRATDGDGNLYWYCASGEKPVSEIDADAYIEKQLKFDPDLWVLEIEDRDGRHFLDDLVQN